MENFIETTAGIDYLARAKAAWLNTTSGRKMYPLDPRVEDFDIGDQAHTLARVNRYGGQAYYTWPVAAHSIVLSAAVYSRAMRLLDQADTSTRESQKRVLEYFGCELQLGLHLPLTYAEIDRIAKYVSRWALTHDNPEAYTGDVIRPLKMLREFKFLQELDLKYELLLNGEWLGLGDRYMPPIVSEMDREICAYEAPIIFRRRLHPAWVLPEKKATGEEEEDILSGINFYLIMSPFEIADRYLDRFRVLFPEKAKEWKLWSR